MSTTKFAVTLPTFDNARNPLTNEIELIKLQVLDFIGAFSTTQVTGAWKNAEGHVCFDTSVCLFTYCEQAQAETLCTYARQWADMLRQDCLLIEISHPSVDFVDSSYAYSIARETVAA